MEALIITTPENLQKLIKEAVNSAWLERDQAEKANDITKEFYSRHEAAKILNVSVSTIDRMIKDGSLTKKKIRSKTLIPAFQLIAIKDKILAA